MIIDFAAIPAIYWAAAAGFVLVVIFGMRERIRAWSDRAEARKLAMRAEDERMATDRLAHYYRSVEEIAARTPEPEELGANGARRWRFGGEIYAAYDDAAEARRAHILRETRAFYQDIDRLRLTRR